MIDQARLQTALDEHEIQKVLISWALARDCGDWEVLANCFQPDATIHISWISGSAAEFVERSKAMLKEFKPGEQGKHTMGASKVDVNGDKAISQIHAELIRRVISPDFDFDTQTWARFVDLFEKSEDGVWRIFKRTMVYDKDRMEPVNPDQVPDGFYDSMNLDRFPPACRFLCYRLSLNNHAPMADIVTTGSDAEKALLAEQQVWLAS